MTAHRLAMSGGGLWGAFRFAAVVFMVLRTGPEGDPLFRVNLTWVGAAALLYSVLFVASAIDPATTRPHLPLLRIGALLHAVADAAVVLSGSHLLLAERVDPAGAPEARLATVIAVGILAVDLLILAALLVYRDRTEEGSG